MKASKFVRGVPVSLGADHTVGEAAQLLFLRGLETVPVVDSAGSLQGLVSRDTLLQAYCQNLPADMPVREIMSQRFMVLDWEESIPNPEDWEFEAVVVFREGALAGVLDRHSAARIRAFYDRQRSDGIDAAIDAVFTPVLAVDKNGRITILNRHAAYMLDIDPSQALGKRVQQMISHPRILEHLLGEPPPGGQKIGLRGRSFIPYSAPVAWGNDEYIGRVLVLRDVSELEEMARETEYTRKLNQQLEAIIESSFDGLYLTDGQANTLLINRGFERIMGITEAECIGRNMAELVEEGVFSRSGTLQALERQETATITLVASTGKEALVTSTPIYDENGEVVLVVTNVRDITELNELQRMLEHVEGLREREMEAVIESSFDGLYITDGQANTLRLNQGFERIMGITKEQCVGRNMAELVEEGVFSRSGTLLALEKQEPVTITLVASTGKEALVTSTPIFDESGNIMLVVTNVRDITELNDLQRRLDHVEELRQLYETELQQLKLASSRRLVANSPQMRELLNLALRVAAVDSTVLVHGESGVGKELVAELIHSNSKRKDQPFIKINCGAIPETLLESELFGYEAGAFTGASKTGKIGLFELAAGGILFLDEIGELPLNLQVKLLRVLQDREIVRIGGGQPIKVDTRILAGTNRNLQEMVDLKQFRLDLYYRLNVIPIRVPPLRERKEDIPVLANHFLNIFCGKYAMTKRLDRKVMDFLVENLWPGNVRELENLIERLVVTSPGVLIGVEDLPAHFTNKVASGDCELVPLREAVEKTERELLQKAFRLCRSTYEVARVLDINQSTVVRKAAKYGIKSK